ncbi:major royal jelly protein 1-like [Anastrepha obliqua]|uniref:major royal jelly protein 1-like n=1 Tax=Anastrepha obliqua TaxID=95512 RepID=UPI0024097DDA|nr:major royal jelly protein 1-like [Anastrepha obliqua]
MGDNMCHPSTIISATLVIACNLLFSAVTPAYAPTVRSNLEIVKQWKLFSFDFPPLAPVSDTNYYNQVNVVPTSMTVAYDRIFIATPKLFSGVPATVSYISKSDYSESPSLQAYPDWSYTVSGRNSFNCSDPYLVSVYRMRIDSCNRLWILDAAVSRTFEDSEQTCQPKILVFDLSTDRVVKRIDIPKDVLRNQSILVNLVIDETTSTSGTCDDVFVYIADTVKPAIIVYDGARDMVWRLSHPAMWPDPDLGLVQVLNDRFFIMDGIIGLALDTVNGILYFQPLATDRIFSITKDALRAGPRRLHDVLPIRFLGKKSSQGLPLYIAPQDGSLLFSPVTETAIVSWNPQTNKQAVLSYDADALQFVADISDSPWDNGVVYAMSSKFNRFTLETVNRQEINFRLMRFKYPSASAVTSQTLFKPSDPIRSDLYTNGQRLNALNDTVYTRGDERSVPSPSVVYNLEQNAKVYQLHGIRNGLHTFMGNSVPAVTNGFPLGLSYSYSLEHGGN